MRDKVPGVDVPNHLYNRINSLPEEQQAQACREEALELTAVILELPHICGIQVISFQGA